VILTIFLSNCGYFFLCIPFWPSKHQNSNEKEWRQTGGKIFTRYLDDKKKSEEKNGGFLHMEAFPEWDEYQHTDRRPINYLTSLYCNCSWLWEKGIKVVFKAIMWMTARMILKAPLPVRNFIALFLFFRKS